MINTNKQYGLNQGLLELVSKEDAIPVFDSLHIGDK